MKRLACAVLVIPIAIGLFVSLGSVSSAVVSGPVSLESLLHEMVSRETLARFPAPAYVCRQASSYDRDTDEVGGDGWFANWDRSQFVRVEENEQRREWVLLDAEGPGAIVRFWGTWHGPGGGPFSNGTLRVYLDGQAVPAIEGPTADLISGGLLVPDPLGESVSSETPYARRGHNLYLPIPFARHCKITYESDELTDIGGKKGEALYYQINYRTYEADTNVVSFQREELQRLQPLVESVAERLKQSAVTAGGPSTETTFDAEIAAGEEYSVGIDGPAAIRRLSLKLKAEDLEQALRSTVLEIEFDGEQSVWCPLGDFFGVGYRFRPYQSWYTRTSEDGTLTSFWVMPFEKACRLTIHNVGRQAVRISDGTLSIGDWQWDDRSLHFHSTWRQYTQLDTGPNKDMTGRGAFDVNCVEIQGRGQYVGDTLTLFNGTAAWWGAGDEKIYIDGESFPSHIGTGTEE